MLNYEIRSAVHIQSKYKDPKDFQFSVWENKFQRQLYSAPIIMICRACSGIVGEIKTTKTERNSSASDNHKQFHVSNRQLETYANNIVKVGKWRFRDSKDVGFMH